MRALLLAFAFVSVGLLIVSSLVVATTPSRGPSSVASSAVSSVQPMKTVVIGTSHLYAGYGVLAAKKVSTIVGTWNIPKFHGKCPSTMTELAFVGIALGGYTNLQQSAFVGTATQCKLGTVSVYSYVAIGTSAGAGTLAVSAGDQVKATISSTGSFVTTILQDLTKGTNVTYGGAVTVMLPTDALWIADVGVNGATILPLADFGNVTFTGCTAVINGTTSHPLGHYSNTAIEMYNNANTAFKAAVGTISSSNKSFTVLWKSTGP